jgi:hypothetical protein
MLAFFLLVPGFALAILFFLGDIAWSLAELGKMFEKAQAAQGM